MSISQRSIWVFADYRNYFQNRVTLQLLAKANDLAPALNAEVCAVVFNLMNMWPNTSPMVPTKFWSLKMTP